MEAPRRPENEPERLAALQALGVLDTAAEERFDRVTRLAQGLFGTPIALVSLVDADRQWFKSCQGLETSETPREVSFCGHAILDDRVFVVEDTHADVRFADNPLVTADPSIRFYAGVPLTVGDGLRVGTLCIIDREPRSLADADIELLQDLASTVEGELSALRLATTDELTGLTNRRGLLEFGMRAIAHADRMGHMVSLMYADLDGLKTINDTLGHETGDQAIRAAGELLRKATRAGDVVARVGGDEFCVLLVGSDAHDVDAVLARIDARLEAHNADPRHPFELSLSAGWVTYAPETHGGFEDLMAQGDAAMYAIKSARRAVAAV